MPPSTRFNKPERLSRAQCSRAGARILTRVTRSSPTLEWSDQMSKSSRRRLWQTPSDVRLSWSLCGSILRPHGHSSPRRNRCSERSDGMRFGDHVRPPSQRLRRASRASGLRPSLARPWTPVLVAGSGQVRPAARGTTLHATATSGTPVQQSRPTSSPGGPDVPAVS